MYAERMSLDINQLKQQYKKLRQRQKQAHIILAGKELLCEFNIILVYILMLVFVQLHFELIII